MTTTAEICRIVIDEQNPLIEAVFDRVGVGERAGEALINKLCGEGILRRQRDRLIVGSKKLAEDLARTAKASAAPPPVSITAPAPSVAPAPPPAAKTPRREIPLPAVIAIRKDVPLPASRRPSDRPCPYPFATMGIGESFVLHVPDGFTAKEVATRINSSVGRFRHVKPEWRFAVRILEDKKTVGCWRTDDATKETPAETPKGITPRSAAHRRGNGAHP